MLIQVIRSDNQYDYIQDYILDSLIETKKIAKFRRSTGWVTVGVHPMRKKKRETAEKDATFAEQYRRAYLSSPETF
ncbi:MAG: GSU3473 family protein [Smithellaceae bacterium]